MSIYKYTVCFIDTDTYKTYEERGYTFANNYSEAMDKIVSYYGEEDIEKCSLSFIADREVLILPNINKYDDILIDKNNII